MGRKNHLTLVLPKKPPLPSSSVTCGADTIIIEKGKNIERANSNNRYQSSKSSCSFHSKSLAGLTVVSSPAFSIKIREVAIAQNWISNLLYVLRPRRGVVQLAYQRRQLPHRFSIATR